jgi:hypothetical protein
VSWIFEIVCFVLVVYLLLLLVLFGFGGGARRFSLENARAIAVYKSPEQRA